MMSENDNLKSLPLSEVDEVWLRAWVDSGYMSAEAYRDEMDRRSRLDKPAPPAGFGWNEIAFRIEVWSLDDQRVDELLALALHIDVARAAYAVALKIRPGRIVRLRNKARVVEEFLP